MSKENCELLARAQALAIKRNLDVTKVECPFIEVCKGERCYMFDAYDSPEENLEVAEDLKRFDRQKIN